MAKPDTTVTDEHAEQLEDHEKRIAALEAAFAATAAAEAPKQLPPIHVPEIGSHDADGTFLTGPCKGRTIADVEAAVKSGKLKLVRDPDVGFKIVE